MSPSFRVLSCWHSNYKWHSFWGEGQLKLKKPAHREKKLQQWAQDFNKLIRLDGKTPDEIRNVLEFVANDKYWWSNVMYASKFRAQYEHLFAKMRAAAPVATANVPDQNPELTQKLIRMYARLINNKDYTPNNGQNIKFIEASRMAKEFYEKHKLLKDNWIRHLENCMYSNYTNKGEVLYPGHLSSSNTWSVLMPQHIAELGGE